MQRLLIFTIFWSATHLTCQHNQQGENVDLIRSLMDISPEPSQRVIANPISIDTTGGHLQGLQVYSQAGHEYAVLSGSSSLYSYLAVAEIGATAAMMNIQKILDKPFKHAGGFQICQNFLAVGIEDNEARNHSFVMIFDISDIKAIPDNPLIKIERKGAFERATAGCVALVKLSGRWLMVVGDWNTEHLDFYVDKDDHLDEFQLVHSISTKNLDRTNWVDIQWRSYQNLNFIVSDDQLFLAGMTSNDQDKNIVDLYSVEWLDNDSFSLQKLATKTLFNTGGDFIWSAGLQVQDGLIHQIVSSDRNLAEHFKFYYYNR